MVTLDTLNAGRWRLVFRQRVTGLANLTNSGRAFFLLPELTTFDTFAVRMMSLSIGTLTNVKLRFGFPGGLAALGLAGAGIDFPGPFVAAGDMQWGSVGYAPGAAGPDVDGNANSILPPCGRVYITTPGVAGRDFTYEVLAADLWSA